MPINTNLQWKHHHETQACNLRSLWGSGEFLDVTLVCDDGQVEAHKVILSSASPFLREILQRNPLLYMRGTSKKDIESVLLFIYSGETQVSQDELESFLALAASLQIQGLVA